MKDYSKLPADVQEDLKSFQESLLDPNISPEDKRFFEAAIEGIETEFNSLIEQPILVENEIVENTLDSSNVLILSNGNYFKKYPEKLLGTIKEQKSKYGKTVQVLIGEMSSVNLIDADTSILIDRSPKIGVSDFELPIYEKIESANNSAFIESVITISESEIGKKAVAKKVAKSEMVNDDFDPSKPEIQTFEEIYKVQNPKISNEELKAYIWYKKNIGQELNENWHNLAYKDEDARSEKEKINDWVKNGILFYYDGNLYPQPIYCSGDIYKKINRITKIKDSENSGQDVKYILDNYGQEVLDKQLQTLNLSFQEINKSRLILTGNDDDNSLILKPISSFSKKTYIDKTNTYEKFEWWEKTKTLTGGEVVVVPDFTIQDASRKRKSVFEKLSLTDAFCYWLTQNNRKIDIKGNITYFDIILYYILKKIKQNPYDKESQFSEYEKWAAAMLRTRSMAMTEGNRLFLEFLNTELDLNQKVTIETKWNNTYNNYLKPDYEKIPVAFNICKRFYDEEPFIIKPEKREAVSFLFNEGSGCLAYDVGVGKTISALMTIEQFLVAGYCKRPFLVVPNQTYKQWISEIKACLPHRVINGLFNLGVEYVEEVLDENNQVKMVADGSITVITYEGFEKIGFNEKTSSDLIKNLYDILNQGGAEEQALRTKASAKKTAGFLERLEELVGKGLKGTNVEIEALGFDLVCFDEAHALKKVFTSVKGEAEEQGKKAKQNYSLQSGMPSSRALKGFMISQYILINNKYRNVLMLTATPFTNSPLEVFSMLSMVAYDQLANLGINNLTDFFDNFIDVSTELVINHKLKPVYKEIVKGFNNLPALQRIILRFFNYKDGEDLKLIRPNKIIIPYTKKKVNGVVVSVEESEQITSSIEMTDIQKKYVSDVVAYAEGKTELGYLSNTIDTDFEIIEDEIKSAEEELSIDSLNSKEKAGVKALRSMNFMRNIALSPYLYEYNDLGKPTYQSYISSSPKLQYVMECISSVKKYHESKNEPVSGQIIFMDRGIQFFGLLKEYLVKKVGFKEHEVGMISSKLTSAQKRVAQDQFLGRKFNEKTQEYESLTDEQRMKVLIGSGSIKEGMNLQKKSTVLYDCFLDWNPTDFTQLVGRIWRQQNEFLNIRIVIPMMFDSIDIFMFQKLEEKTARINSIWSNDGKSVLKIEEVDTQELKENLIRDPFVLAKMEVETKGAKIKDDLNSINRINDRLKELFNANSRLENYNSELTKFCEEYIQKAVDLPTKEKAEAVINFFKQAYPKDNDGKIIISYYDKKYEMESILKKFKPEQISAVDKPSKPYWVEYVAEYKRLIEKETKDLLNPRNIKIEEIESYIENSKLQAQKLQNEIKFLESDDYANMRVVEIEKTRAENKYEIKPISKLVEEFERMNYLLSLKLLSTPKESTIKEYDSCVFLDENNVPRIDDASIKALTECVERLPQTKDSHLDINGEYTDDRTILHLEIMEEFKQKVKCITNSEQPIAILLGGSPASGKSTFLKTFTPYLLDDGILKIDADAIRAKLPEYKGWNASATHNETKDIVNTLLTNKSIGIPCSFDMIYDGTMNSAKNYLPLIGTLKSLNYKIFIIYMDNVPYMEVKRRMLKRYQTSGRFVPLTVIDDFFTKGKAALNELKTKVDGYMVVDGSSTEYAILEQGGEPLPQTRDYGKISQENKVSGIKTKLIEVIKTLDEVADISKEKLATQNKPVRPNGLTDVEYYLQTLNFGKFPKTVVSKIKNLLQDENIKFLQEQEPVFVELKEQIEDYANRFEVDVMIGTSSKTTTKETEPETTNSIQSAIESLNLSIDFLEGEDKDQMQAAIEALEIALEFS